MFNLSNKFLLINFLNSVFIKQRIMCKKILIMLFQFFKYLKPFVQKIKENKQIKFD